MRGHQVHVTIHRAEPGPYTNLSLRGRTHRVFTSDPVRAYRRTGTSAPGHHRAVTVANVRLSNAAPVAGRHSGIRMQRPRHRAVTPGGRCIQLPLTSEPGKRFARTTRSEQ